MEKDYWKALAKALFQMLEDAHELELSDYLKANLKQHLLSNCCTEWHGTIHSDAEFIQCDNCGGAYPLDDHCDCEGDDEWFDYKKATRV